MKVTEYFLNEMCKYDFLDYPILLRKITSEDLNGYVTVTKETGEPKLFYVPSDNYAQSSYNKYYMTNLPDRYYTVSDGFLTLVREQ